MTYPWYQQLVSDYQLEQGDLITECPIVIPPKEYKGGETYDAQIFLMNTVILSQSCDLAQRKVDLVLVCPYYSLKTYIDSYKATELAETRDNKVSEAIRKHIDGLKRGNNVGYHLLNKDAESNDIEDYLLVDFRNVYGVQLDVLTDLVTKRETRYRLLPPYREHLSQAFARYFMRVGLPQDIKIEGY